MEKQAVDLLEERVGLIRKAVKVSVALDRLNGTIQGMPHDSEIEPRTDELGRRLSRKIQQRHAAGIRQPRADSDLGLEDHLDGCGKPVLAAAIKVKNDASDMAVSARAIQRVPHDLGRERAERNANPRSDRAMTQTPESPPQLAVVERACEGSAPANQDADRACPGTEAFAPGTITFSAHPPQSRPQSRPGSSGILMELKATNKFACHANPEVSECLSDSGLSASCAVVSRSGTSVEVFL